MNKEIIPFKPELVPYTPPPGLETFRKTFLVPKKRDAVGLVVYLSGLPGIIDEIQPMALVIAEGFLCLCNPDGIRWWYSILDIRRVSVADLSDISIPIQAPDGQTIYMNPPNAKGLSIEVVLKTVGVDEISIYTLSPSAAQDWRRRISAARQDFASRADRTGGITG